VNTSRAVVRGPWSVVRLLLIAVHASHITHHITHNFQLLHCASVIVESVLVFVTNH
jgi:hypothetical protein